MVCGFHEMQRDLAEKLFWFKEGRLAVDDEEEEEEQEVMDAVANVAAMSLTVEAMREKTRVLTFDNY